MAIYKVKRFASYDDNYNESHTGRNIALGALGAGALIGGGILAGRAGYLGKGAQNWLKGEGKVVATNAAKDGEKAGEAAVTESEAFKKALKELTEEGSGSAKNSAETFNKSTDGWFNRKGNGSFKKTTAEETAHTKKMQELEEKRKALEQKKAAQAAQSTPKPTTPSTPTQSAPATVNTTSEVGKTAENVVKVEPAPAPAPTAVNTSTEAGKTSGKVSKYNQSIVEKYGDQYAAQPRTVSKGKLARLANGRRAAAANNMNNRLDQAAATMREVKGMGSNKSMKEFLEATDGKDAMNKLDELTGFSNATRARARRMGGTVKNKMDQVNQTRSSIGRKVDNAGRGRKK